MHPFHDYLAGQLEDRLRKRSIVVFYDPRDEFRPFFEHELSLEDGEPLPRASIAGRSVFLAQYGGSLFGLRAAVEPVVAADEPEPLILYLPGVQRDRTASVLMELEMGGACYEPPLRRLAQHALRKQFTDGQIDELMRTPTLTYQDVAAVLGDGERGRIPSVLHRLFGGAKGEALIVQWLVSDTEDAALVEKQALEELYGHIRARLGLELPADTGPVKGRALTCRYVLVNEFRADLACEPPAAVSTVPRSVNKDQMQRIRAVAETLRRDWPNAYVGLADQVEQDLGLQSTAVDAQHLGSIDTFRFEEARLLGHAGALIAAKDFGSALAIIAARGQSFWVHQSVHRQAQWEACRLMAELGEQVTRIRPLLTKLGAEPAKWVAAYTDADGWHRADGLQRQLESWIAHMDDEPEAYQALGVVRQAHEHLLRAMADGFGKALSAAGWTIPGSLHQTHIYPDVVQAMGGRVAYFLVDAMRFEMGVELARQIQGATDLRVRPGIAALPSITPVGMAALLPGASASFDVVETKGALAARVEGTTMAGLNERLKLLKARVPNVAEMTLGKLLSHSPRKLGSAIAGAPLVVVRSQEIDFLGETDGDLLARQVMDAIIGNLARAVKKLAAAGIEHFVITADHGHQFALRKDDDMKIDSPGGQTLDLHRRCWIGHGGSTPGGSVRLTGAELGYRTDLEFVFPGGLGVFKAGGGLSFHHGGFSLQELVIPVISLRMGKGAVASAAPGVQVRIQDCPGAVTNRMFVIKLVAEGDLLATEPLTLRVLLMSSADEVGRAGMATGAAFDRSKATLNLELGKAASVGLALNHDTCKSLRVVVLDAATDALLAQSDELPVKLGI